MPIVAVAVCPHPPLLVPEVAAGAAGELDGLRSACAAALAELADAGVRHIAVIGVDERTTTYDHPFRGSLAPWGVPLRVGVGPAESIAGKPLPLSLLVGFWLLEHLSPASEPITYSAHGVAADAAPAECADLGVRLAGGEGTCGLLVMGDGSACRSEQAPGYFDHRAEGFDAAVSAALAAADPAALMALDPDLAAQLRVAGRAPWQVLAGAALAAGGAWSGKLHYADAPYGVGYFVASWRRLA